MKRPVTSCQTVKLAALGARAPPALPSLSPSLGSRALAARPRTVEQRVQYIIQSQHGNTPLSHPVKPRSCSLDSAADRDDDAAVLCSGADGEAAAVKDGAVLVRAVRDSQRLRKDRAERGTDGGDLQQT